MSDVRNIEPATFNQMANIKNPHQGSSTKALCVCSAGLLRSPTIAKVLTEKGYNTRACGTSQEYALIPLTEALLLWADIIYVVKEQSCVIEEAKKKFGCTTPTVVLDIPDMYGTFSKDLEEIIINLLKETK